MARPWMLLAAVAVACGGTAAEGESRTPDGGADAEEPAVPDSGPEDAADAGVFEASVPPKPDGGTQPCSALVPTPAFCDDFDDGDLNDDWDVLNVSPGSNVALDTAGYASAPASFALKTSAVPIQETAFAHLRTTIAGAPSHVRLSFSAYLPNTALAKGTLALATVDVSQSHFFTLFLRDGDPDAPAATLEEVVPGKTTRHVLGSPPPANTWTRIVVDVDLGAGKASVSWDATKALDGATVATTPGAQDPTIRVGAIYVFGPQDPFEGRIDDVLFETL